jgi:hypothetical protein
MTAVERVAQLLRDTPVLSPAVAEAARRILG